MQDELSLTLTSKGMPSMMWQSVCEFLSKLNMVHIDWGHIFEALDMKSTWERDRQTINMIDCRKAHIREKQSLLVDR